MQPEQKKSLFKRGFGVGGATLVDVDRDQFINAGYK
jgi:hypothetical protein